MQKGAIKAQAELQLMWDDKNKRPVLFLEELCTALDRKEEGSKAICKAIVEYAKKRAEALGLDLVTRYEEKNGMLDPEKPSLPYEGTVTSLGSSSPIEYVNTYFDIINGPYSVGATNIVQASYKPRTPPCEIEVNGKKYTWSLHELKNLLINLRNAHKDYHLIKSDLSIEQRFGSLPKLIDEMISSFLEINPEHSRAILEQLGPK